MSLRNKLVPLNKNKINWTGSCISDDMGLKKSVYQYYSNEITKEYLF